MATDAELTAAATVNGMFDRWGGAMGGDAEPRDHAVTAFGLNGRPMLHEGRMTRDQAKRRAEELLARPDVSRVKGGRR